VDCLQVFLKKSGEERYLGRSLAVYINRDRPKLGKTKVPGTGVGFLDSGLELLTQKEGTMKEMHSRRRIVSAQKVRRGLTLIEVLIVLTILLIIASLAVTNLIAVQRRAYINAARTQIKAFEQPLHAYYLDFNEYPPSLDALITPPADLADPTKWNGPYLDAQAVPLDPWGREYQYLYPGQYNTDKPDIWSLGPDGVDGTEDDITNWGQ
jgi:general secretion pathway protein G